MDEPTKPDNRDLNRIRAEIRELNTQLENARQLAIFVGMTSAEAKLYEERRERILQLAHELQSLGGNFLDTITSTE